MAAQSPHERFQTLLQYLEDKFSIMTQMDGSPIFQENYTNFIEVMVTVAEQGDKLSAEAVALIPQLGAQSGESKGQLLAKVQKLSSKLQSIAESPKVPNTHLQVAVTIRGHCHAMNGVANQCSH